MATHRVEIYVTEQKKKTPKKGKKFPRLFRVSMYPVDVTIGYDDSVKWRCHGGKIAVDFKDSNHPFQADSFPNDAADETDLDSGVCVKRRKAKYPYTVTITPKRGSGLGDITIDPNVVVEDPGPPDGGRRSGPR